MEEARILWAAMGWLTLNRYKVISQYYGNLQKAWNEIDEGFLVSIGENKERINSFLDKKSNVNLNIQKSLLSKYQTKILFFEDKDYPENLKNIGDPPIFLYVQGEILAQDNISLAVVGSRKISSYGKQVCTKIVSDLVHKFTIVSGFAQGIDTKAHEAALDYGGRTIAVLGHGLDMIYPIGNSGLASRILSENKGAVISEFSFGIGPEKYNFPRRNRIIAGMSLGTFVVEARESSGSLITADLALNYNREVFSVPGNIYSSESEGTNNLIKKGEAKLVTSAEDILSEFDFVGTQNAIQLKIEFDGDEEEVKILSILDKVGKDFSMIALETGFSQSTVSSKMMMLELKGQVMDLGMGMWTLN